MEMAPHWSRLRNPMIMRIYNDVILGLTTAHWSIHSSMNISWCPTEGPELEGTVGIRASQRPHCLDIVFL